jgi:hypothetical protein
MRFEKKDLEASRPCLGDVLGGEGGYCGIAVIGGDIEPLLSALPLPAPFCPSACSKFSCRWGDAGFDLGDLDDLGLRVEGLRCWRLSASAGLLVALRFNDGGAVDFGILQILIVLLFAVLPLGCLLQISVYGDISERRLVGLGWCLI